MCVSYREMNGFKNIKIDLNIETYARIYKIKIELYF